MKFTTSKNRGQIQASLNAIKIQFAMTKAKNSRNYFYVSHPNILQPIIFSVLFLLNALSALAQVTVIPGYTFVTNNNAITITKYVSSTLEAPGEVYILDYTNGYPIVGIGDYAFANQNMASVRIPASITNISEGAFAGCPFLTNIVVDVINPSFTNVDGSLFNKSMTLLLQYPAALATYNYTNYTVPNTVKKIGASAFEDCFGLTGVTLPDNISSIGYEAFYDCESLTNLLIPDSVTNIDAFAFSSSGLTSVTIPDSVVSIGTNAFASCFNLANVNLANGITNIGWGVFAYCSISSIIIPSSVSSLGKFALGSLNLTNIYFLGNAPAADPLTFSGDEQATAYYLPGATGWVSTLAGIPTTLWLPTIQMTNNLTLSDPLSFNISWASGQTVVVEACTNLSNHDWQPLETNILNGSSLYFRDLNSTNYQSRFYRIRSP